ncbi:hypothetical protein [Paenibacillus sp. MMS18-CY102]|uniref:hypothetical protein n=1 Tax=Paenibacillus sp. MMS18-CY102 TaxID=2682849 RepID=UPI0013660F10|nr:hypothetical protein [Paenibacillus sp. MMS18-CY102]MWC31385.1 hypothetical protein [Paenibacillus sp. MMS18-CY102]
MRSMKYFVLEHDRRSPANGANINFPARMLQGYHYAEEQEIVYAKQGCQISPSSLIEHPILLISDPLRKTIARFIPDVGYKSIVVMDLGQQSQFYYSWMDFVEIPCLMPERMEAENGRISKMHVEDVSEDAAIFQISHYRSRVLVARVDVAECLLRTGLYGLKVRPIQLMRGDG